MQAFHTPRSSAPDTVITRMFSPVPVESIPPDAQTPQTPRLITAKQIPDFVHLDLSTSEATAKETLWSAHKMRECRKRQRRIQAQDTKVNDQRIMHEYIRFLCAVTTSHFKKAGNLRYDQLSRLAQVPEGETLTWLGHAYHASPRALSVDATAWTYWDTPVCPWTTWRASWNERGIHFTPPPNPSKPTKTSFPRRLKERFLAKFQQKPSSQKHKTPHYVRAFRRTLPFRRPRSAVKKTPTAQQGGFIEHLDENARYQDMVNSDGGKGVVHVKKSRDAEETEALIHAQKNGADAKGRTTIGIDGKSVDDDAAIKERRTRDIIMMVIGWFLCPGQLSRRPRNGLRKGRAEHNEPKEELLKKKEV